MRTRMHYMNDRRRIQIRKGRGMCSTLLQRVIVLHETHCCLDMNDMLALSLFVLFAVVWWWSLSFIKISSRGLHSGLCVDSGLQAYIYKGLDLLSCFQMHWILQFVYL